MGNARGSRPRGPVEILATVVDATRSRLINRLKQFQRIATRYEKRGVNYLAMVIIVVSLLWL